MRYTKTILVRCPCCDGTLEVNAANGHVLRFFEARDQSDSGDQLADALKAATHAAARAEEKFRAFQEESKTKMDRLEETFLKKTREVEESGDTSCPLREIDL